MKMLIQLEELAMFLLALILFFQLSYAWWVFPFLLFIPDIGMLGYCADNKIGAITYNLFHYKGIAIALYIAGIYWQSEIIQLAGIILFAHASMDRALGYGLKTFQGFSFTHLGKIKTPFQSDS